MNDKTLRRRPGTAQVILTLLLLVGVGLAWGVHQANSNELKQAALLSSIRDRVCADVATMSDSLQGLSMDTKNEQARKHGREAHTDFAAAIDVLGAAFADRAELITSVKNLNALYDRILDQVDADAAAAMLAYHKNYGAFLEESERMLKDFNRQVEAVTTAEMSRAMARNAAVTSCLCVILIVSVLTLWLQSAALAKPVAGLTEAMERMRRGDFTRRVIVDGAEQFRELGDGLNFLAEDLSLLVGQMQRSGMQVNATAAQIAAAAKEQQGTAREIAATTAEIGAASKQISETSTELVKAIDEVSHVAKDAGQLANSGQTAIGRMETTMRQINEASGAITAKLAVLNERTANINTIVTTITKVADQTNLLSLNAAIEAEKAGEYGLGFAVVAMEIRRLADQTAVATCDIEKAVKEMQSAVATGVMGMDKFSEEVRSGVGEIRQVGAQLGQVIQQVQMLTPRFQTVDEGVHAQAAGAKQICLTLAQLSQAAQQTAESLHDSDLAIEQLNDAVRGLQSSVARFKLEG